MQLMLNIIKNSQEAVEKNEHDKTIFLVAKVCDDRLIIQVKDNGHGLDKADSKKLFTKGFTTKQASSGLGLYNCRIIAESHDGTIDITSEGPGKGAVTTIKFKLN
jgi:sensor histidine kinase regulating citrate/malate metabolism